MLNAPWCSISPRRGGFRGPTTGHFVATIAFDDLAAYAAFMQRSNSDFQKKAKRADGTRTLVSHPLVQDVLSAGVTGAVARTSPQLLEFAVVEAKQVEVAALGSRSFEQRCKLVVVPCAPLGVVSQRAFPRESFGDTDEDSVGHRVWAKARLGATPAAPARGSPGLALL